MQRSVSTRTPPKRRDSRKRREPVNFFDSHETDDGSIDYKIELAKYRSSTRRRRFMNSKRYNTVVKIAEDLIKKLLESYGPQEEEESEKGASEKKAETLFQKLYTAFNAYDAEKDGEIGLKQYCEARKFCGFSKPDEQLARDFRKIDIDNCGFIEFFEFAFSIIGENALNHGPIAKMERLKILVEKRLEENEKLKQRLENITQLITKENELAMSQDWCKQEVNSLLEETYFHFGNTKKGIGLIEFISSWEFLNIQGEEGEITKCFSNADKDNVGKLNCEQFKDAIFAERFLELSIPMVFTYHNLKHEHRTAKIRRLERDQVRMQNERFEQNEILRKRCHALLSKLDPKIESESMDENLKEYEKVKQVFTTFNRHRFGLDYESFCEAWDFLEKPYDDEELKFTFNAVAHEEFGLVDWDQFLFSVLGDKAKLLLPLCQIERLESLLNSYSFRPLYVTRDLQSHLKRFEHITSDLQKTLNELGGLNIQSQLWQENHNLKIEMDKIHEENGTSSPVINPVHIRYNDYNPLNDISTDNDLGVSNSIPVQDSTFLTVNHRRNHNHDDDEDDSLSDEEELDEEIEDDICVNCSKECCGKILMPCGHSNFCLECCNKLLHKRICSVCNTCIESIIEL